MGVTSVKPRIAILGCGIKGASTAALLAATNRVTIQVFERRTPGSGITSTNHGRYHRGPWNYRSNSLKIVRRYQESYEIASRLPNVWETSKPGVYCVESEIDTQSLLDFCSRAGVPATEITGTDLWPWICPERLSIFLIRALTQVWCNSKSQKAVVNFPIS